MWHKSFVQTLEKQYDLLRSKNSRFSRRAYALKLGISSGTLSDVTKFKTRLTRERAIQILDRLSLPDREYKRLLLLMGRAGELSENFPSFSDKKLELIVDWVSRAILYSFDMEMPPSVEEISRRLRIPQTEVETRLEQMLEANLLQRSETGVLEKVKVIWRTSDGIASDFIKSLHLSNFEVMKKSLLESPVESRDFTAVTFAGNRRQLEAARAEIRAFYERLLALMEEPPTDEVYQMTISLFPLHFPEPRDQTQESK